MIKLSNVYKSYRRYGGRQIVLENISIDIDLKKNVGILGRNGAGKSTLVRILAKAEPPDSGEVIHTSKVSWPLGYGGVLLPTLTGEDNARLISQLYGADIGKVLDEVQQFAELGPYFKMPVSTYSSGMRARLSFGLSLAIDFECYLIDEILSVGDHRFRKKSKQAIEQRREKESLILVSHNPNTIKEHCDTAMVLSAGQLQFFDDVDSAIEAYQSL